jgi:hypothetical protein
MARFPRLYRKTHAWLVMFGFIRLNGASRTEAAGSIVAHKICGTPMYYDPKRRRAEMMVPADRFELPTNAV